MLKNYFKIALRNILRNRGFSIINILGLAVGLACAVLISLWIIDETSYDDFNSKKDSIYRVLLDFENGSQATLCGTLSPAIKNEIPEIKNSTRIWSGWESQIYYNDTFTKSKGRFADPSIFDIFTFPFVEGNSETALAGKHSIVITQSIAAKLFGNESAIGKIVQIKNRRDEKEDFSIGGVINDLPANSHIQFDFLFSYDLLNEWFPQYWMEDWGNNSFCTYILTNSNSSQEMLSKKITDCYRSHSELSNSIRVEPLNEVYLDADISNLLGPSGDSLYIKIFFIIACLLVIVACINYANLSIAKSIYRAREVGLRKVVGAKKIEIIVQNIGESILLALMAFPVAVILIQCTIPLFNSVVGKALLINYLDYRIILGMLCLVLVTGFVSGLYPAFFMSSLKPIKILKNEPGNIGIRNSIRKSLVVFQFALSMVIIVSALVISRQMNYLQDKNLGYEKENLLYAWVPGTNNEVLKSELLKNPNILSVGASGAQLDWLGWASGINTWDGVAHEDYISFGTLEVGFDYLDTYKMQMADGRYYSRNFTSDQANSIIVNEAAVKVMNLKNPVGKTMFYSGKDRTIVGVVKDFNYGSLRETIGPMMFLLYPQKLPCLGIRVAGKDIRGTIGYINNVFKTNILDDKVEVKFLDDQLNQLYNNEIREGKLFFYFSFILIFIALLGLLGLSSYNIERRKKELGIRKALGASIPGIISILIKEYLLWILIANVIAAPAAYYFMTNWLEGFAYRINIGVVEFLTAGGFVLLIALLTVGVGAIKAATANLVEALRYE